MAPRAAVSSGTKKLVEAYKQCKAWIQGRAVEIKLAEGRNLCPGGSRPIVALAHLIVRAAKNTQLWITTHAQTLADRIEKHSGVACVRLRMSDGETQVS